MFLTYAFTIVYISNSSWVQWGPLISASAGSTHTFAISWQIAWRMLVLGGLTHLSWSWCWLWAEPCTFGRSIHAFFQYGSWSKQQKEGQSQHASSFQVSVCITVANVSVAKTSQIARPKSMWEGLMWSTEWYDSLGATAVTVYPSIKSKNLWRADYIRVTYI